MSKTAYELYNGEITLLFNAKNHTYYLDEYKRANVVPNATSVTSVVSKEGLMYWSVNQAIEYLQDNLTAGILYDELELAELFEDARTQHTKKKKQAATVGSLVHNWIQDYTEQKVAGKEASLALPVNLMAKKAVISFLEWVEENQVMFHATEQKCYSKELNCAGTLDTICTVNGTKCIGDYKTSTGIYKEMFYQVAFYRYAKTEETGEGYGGCFILHIPKDGGLVVPYYIDTKMYAKAVSAFKACLELYRENKFFESFLRTLDNI